MKIASEIYNNLIGNGIKVTLTDDRVFIGRWCDWTSALDNEPNEASITIDGFGFNSGSTLIELSISEIKSIEPAPK